MIGGSVCRTGGEDSGGPDAGGLGLDVLAGVTGAALGDGGAELGVAHDTRHGIGRSVGVLDEFDVCAGLLGGDALGDET